MEFNKKEFIERLHSVVGENSVKFAEHAGITSTGFRKYFKGSVPPADKMLAISELSGKSLSWLLTGKEDPKTNKDFLIIVYFLLDNKTLVVYYLS